MNKDSLFVAVNVAVTTTQFCKLADKYLAAAAHERLLRDVDIILENARLLRLGKIS